MRRTCGPRPCGLATWSASAGRRCDRLLRYGAASCILAPLTLVLLYVLNSVAGWEAWHANLVSVSVGSVPAYLINRYWVWSRTGRSRLWREVVPFWAITVVGAAASTTAVDAASRWDNSGLIVLMNFGTYAVLWLVKFFLLDRYLWPTPGGNVRQSGAAGS